MLHHRPIPEAVERIAQDATAILDDTELCLCPACEAWVERSEGTHSIPTDGYTDGYHPVLIREQDGRLSMRADIRECLWMIHAAWADSGTVAEWPPETE